jgi:hypothetical protein
VSGTISLTGGVVAGVLELIQQQLNPNCPGTSVEFRIFADAGNQVPVFVGQSGATEVSCTNYGAVLTPMSGERKYRASFPGSGTPQGLIQVFAEANAKIHVEVNT